MIIFPGYQMESLTKRVCQILGIRPAKIQFDQFSDTEFLPQVQRSVHGKRIFIIMSLHSSDSIMANYLALKALRRSHAKIIPVISYYGYGRQDRRDKRGVPISAKDIAEMITLCDPEDVVILDPHNRCIEAFFKESTLLYGSFILIPALKKFLKLAGFDPKKISGRIVQIAPDDGRSEYNNFYARELGIPLVLQCKKITIAHNKKKVVFNDTRLPKNAVVILSDDLIDTFGTIEGAITAIDAMSKKLYGAGCSAFIVSGTHGRLSGEANTRVVTSLVQKIIITDSIPVLQERCEKIISISIAPVLAEAIKRIHRHQSISAMFKMKWSDKLP